MTRILAWLHKLPISVYLVVAGITVFGGWLSINNARQRERGALNARIAQAERTNAALRHEADSLAKRYRVDTLRLTKIRQVTDSLTVTVERWKRDTLTVVEYVTKADSTIRVCTQALVTCEARVALATRGWDGARAEIAVIKASYPSKAKPWVYGLAGLGIGVVAGRLIR